MKQSGDLLQSKEGEELFSGLTQYMETETVILSGFELIKQNKLTPKCNSTPEEIIQQVFLICLTFKFSDLCNYMFTSDWDFARDLSL